MRSTWLGDMRDAQLSSRCIKKSIYGRYEQQAPDGVVPVHNVRNALYSAQNLFECQTFAGGQGICPLSPPSKVGSSVYSVFTPPGGVGLTAGVVLRCPKVTQIWRRRAPTIERLS